MVVLNKGHIFSIIVLSTLNTKSFRYFDLPLQLKSLLLSLNSNYFHVQPGIKQRMVYMLHVYCTL